MKEIRIVMGYNAAGKSTHVKIFEKQGYVRINRDLLDCSLDDLVSTVNDEYLRGTDRVVLDNTYGTIKSRKSLIEYGKKKKVPVCCTWMDTSFEDAQLNACLRMIQKTGTILQPDDFKKSNDPNLFPPAALFAYRKSFEEPTLEEGFHSVVKWPFKREWPSDYTNKALILDYDGTLRVCTGKEPYPVDPSEIQILPKRREILLKYQKDGYILTGASNQSGISKGKVSLEKVRECFAKTNELLGLAIDFNFCQHRIPPVTCYCRKPHPAMGAYLIVKHKLNPADCIMVGDMTTDETFAQRCGFQYVDANTFFA